MNSIALGCVLSYTLASIIILVKIWKKDVFFSIFMTMIVLYSTVAQWGYLIYPEISEIVLKMYFGIEALILASIFSTLSLTTLYFGYLKIYRPLTRSRSFQLNPSRKLSGFYISACFLYTITLIFGYFYYQDALSYSNASDETFLIDAGKRYALFIQLYKFSVFVILVMYSVIRQRLLPSTLDRFICLLLIGTIFVFFVATTIGTGSRSDPLVLILGLLGFEYYRGSTITALLSPVPRSSRILLSGRIKRLILTLIVLILTVIILTILESARNESSSVNETLDASRLVQTVLIKDYYPPFHLLIGAISYNYVDPLTVVASNIANSLMFLGVDFLQSFVVNQWEPGLATRTASPALFAFTEGFVAMGWAGFLYNGLVWSGGIALWRLFSRTNDERFNALAFAITVALAASVPRSQSAYFIKDIYLWFFPALLLYCLAAGLSPFRPHKRIHLRSVAER